MQIDLRTVTPDHFGLAATWAVTPSISHERKKRRAPRGSSALPGRNSSLEHDRVILGSLGIRLRGGLALRPRAGTQLPGNVRLVGGHVRVRVGLAQRCAAARLDQGGWLLGDAGQEGHDRVVVGGSQQRL